MKIINTPAYSYFNNFSYRTDLYFITDSELIRRLQEKYPSTGRVWSRSGGVFNNFADEVNEVIGAPVLNPTVRLYQVYNKTHEPDVSLFNSLSGLINAKLDMIKIDDSYDLPTSGTSIDRIHPTRIISLKNDELAIYLGNGNGGNLGNYTFYNMNSTISSRFYCTTVSTTITGHFIFSILPDNIFDSNALIPRDVYVSQNLPAYRLEVQFTCQYDQYGLGDVKSYSIWVNMIQQPGNTWLDLDGIYHNFNVKSSGMNYYELDEDNPYGYNGSSGMGGGDGTLNARGLDAVDPAEVPALPSINAADLGFMTMYNPSASQLRQLSDFMWSNMFDLNTYKKLFSDPMESIIGLAVVPINPTLGGSKTVKFGTIDSGISMSYLSSNWASLDCGWCSVEKYIGAFLDSDPYTKVNIYLPFIGIRQLSADDVNGRGVHVVYHVDVLTGACAAFIEVEDRGVLYTYNGSCITNIPLTSVNFSGAIQNAVSAVISGIGTVAGMATGAAPITAMGITGLVNSAANTALNSKPAIQRSGNLGGSAGIMSIMTPYLIIERPDISVPYNVQHYIGQTCNITMKLDQCSGFTVCEFIHLEDVPATTEEISEIESLLAQGVYL